ncbi:SNF2 domain-containing protein [Alloalcanivorax xenomutans]|uniref:helicase-related protein n=1 Tax=Alloalcanivorax xenomutans TaxID=1094342 RepID=UPI000BD9A9A6|nr:helicase-related protein [Alloalcanivorax xenomutans]SOC01033.1 SNF2 domain-containing protein [Alloalcanivorax xenomutans]
MVMPIVEGAFVRLKDSQDAKDVGLVQKVSDEIPARVKVYWVKRKASVSHPETDLTSGLMRDMEVEHCPVRATQNPLGWGIVRATRNIAGHAQALVEFQENNQRLWLPWQRLRQVRGALHSFNLGRFEGEGGEERQRLRLLSWAIQLWNENTGALATFDVDPLPHQIHLVHHIIGSGHYNWLIADDVGLGKTIEVGLLLHAAMAKGEADRVLIITPAGLTRQWKEELYGKFGFEGFRIYGDDFQIHDPRDWKKENHVIGSMDRLKQDDNLNILLQADDWDLVIVDEAHRLSRRQYGNKLDASQRYAMLHKLRKRAQNVLLLTATPHQGKQDSFGALLELLDQDRKSEIRTLALNPEIISDMVIRNYKADVTDMEGNFLFHGKTVRQIDVPLSEEAVEFDKQLREYLRKGYAAQDWDGKAKGRAIGFVMTVYRKLAASSVAAIHTALQRRLERLRGEEKQATQFYDDERYQGEQEEIEAQKTQASPFFPGEEGILEGLIAKAASLEANDAKRRAFMDGLVETVIKENAQEKILVFTEYRSTQKWVKDALDARFGNDSCVLIHGGMDMQERREAIAAFEEDGGAQFLVSTEAGGEGINLQHRCHIMVNYDLPWNPMRLVQRVGRLYRYGQKKRVVVFNVHQSDSADEQVLSILYDRLESVAQDMANVQRHEFNDAIKEDVLGELADLVDIEEVLAEAANDKLERTSERINEALERAKKAASEQQELFKHAVNLDNKEVAGELVVTVEHLQAFIEGMARIVGFEVMEKTHKGLVWQIKLTEGAMESLGVVRSRFGLAFDRMLAAKKPELLPMNMDNWLFKGLIALARKYDFGGTAVAGSGYQSESVIVAVARWQNDRGRRARQELAMVAVENGNASLNPPWFSEWLMQPCPPSECEDTDKAQRKASLQLASERMEKFLAAQSSETLLPDQMQWISAGWKGRGRRAE